MFVFIGVYSLWNPEFKDAGNGVQVSTVHSWIFDTYTVKLETVKRLQPLDNYWSFMQTYMYIPRKGGKYRQAECRFFNYIDIAGKQSTTCVLISCVHTLTNDIMWNKTILLTNAFDSGTNQNPWD